MSSPDETVTCNEEIEPDVDFDQLRSEPYSLPPEFYWSDIELSNTNQLKELYTLLNENYVEDEDNMFRFDYSPEFLRWYVLLVACVCLLLMLMPTYSMFLLVPGPSCRPDGYLSGTAVFG